MCVCIYLSQRNLNISHLVKKYFYKGRKNKIQIVNSYPWLLSEKNIKQVKRAPIPDAHPVALKSTLAFVILASNLSECDSIISGTNFQQNVGCKQNNCSTNAHLKKKYSNTEGKTLINILQKVQKFPMRNIPQIIFFSKRF